MLPVIIWHGADEQPPKEKRLLIITKDGAFGVGGFCEINGKTMRYIVFWDIEPKNGRAGELMYWAELPSNAEIRQAVGDD